MLARKSQYFAVLVLNRLQCEIQTIQTTQQTKTSDQLSPSVVDYAPTSDPNCRYISCKIFSLKLPKINFVWMFCGEIQVQSTQDDWENSEL